jgi:hypothetical protein
MKKTLAAIGIGLSLCSAPIQAAPPNSTNTVTAVLTMIVDPSVLGGMNSSQYASMFSAVLISSPDITVPTNLWPVHVIIPVTNLLSQGLPGTAWTNPIVTDGATRFFLSAYTNVVNGGPLGPFSPAAPLVWVSPQGRVGVSR